MKKLIALMMCAMLLLSGCSAVTANGPGTGIQIRDLVVGSSDGRTTDLTGMSVTVESAESDTSLGARISVAAGGQESADLILGMVGQYLYLSVDGIDGTHTLALDLDRVIQVLSDAYQSILGTVTSILPAIFSGEDLPEGAAFRDFPEEIPEDDLDALLAELEEVGSPLEDYLEDADPAPSVTTDPAAEKIDEIINRCVTAEEQQIEGEAFQTLTLNFAEADMAELFDTIMMSDLSGVTLGQFLASRNISCALTGTVTGNEDFSRFLIDLTPVISAEGDMLTLPCVIDGMSADGSVGVSVSSAQDGQDLASLSLTYVRTTVVSADWLPAEPGPETVMLTELSPNGALDAFTGALDAYLEQIGNMAETVSQANAG